MNFAYIENYGALVGYISVGIIFAFFLYLAVILLKGTATMKEAQFVASTTNTLWAIALPLSVLVGFGMFFSSGAPGVNPWTFILETCSLILFFLFSLFSFTSVWTQYKLGEYNRVIRIAMTPFIFIFLFIILYIL